MKFKQIVIFDGKFCFSNFVLNICHRSTVCNLFICLNNYIFVLNIVATTDECFPCYCKKRNKMENGKLFFANMGPMINCRLINLHMLNTSMFTLLSGFIAKINKSFLAQNTSALRNNISFSSFVNAKKTKLLMMNKSCFEISRTFRKVLLTTTIITSYGYSKTFIERSIEENCKS
jgi:hypothetical protein